MTNIIRQRQEERFANIAKIQKMISIRVKDKTFDRKLLVLSAMSTLGLSKRTTQEYVEVALFNEGVDLK